MNKWQSRRSFANTNLHMLEEEALCDVIFLVGEKKQAIKAHKFILSSRSPVFYAIFCSSQPGLRSTITVRDIEADTFRQLLKYLYTGKCSITPDIVMSLLNAANKYDVTTLASECREFVESRLSPGIVCTVLQKTGKLNDKALENRCIQYINGHAEETLKSESFLSLSKDFVKAILHSDYLSVNEEDIYAACMRWATEQCEKSHKVVSDVNLRHALDDVITLIRFPLMTLESLLKLCQPAMYLQAMKK